MAVDGVGDPHIVKQVLSVRKIAFGVPPDQAQANSLLLSICDLTPGNRRPCR